MNEIWKDVKGFEGLYQISNLGNIMSLRYNKVLSRKASNGDYITAVLFDGNGNKRNVRIHVLVAENFIKDIPKGYQVHHKDENKQNNMVENLEIVSPKEHHKLTLKEHPNLIDGMVYYNKYTKCKSVLQYSLDGKLIAEYPNCKEASKATGVCHRNILQVASKTPFNSKGNVRKQAGGFVWKYKDEKGVVLCS